MPPFRILSLSGGGARGIFQAVFLSRLQKELGKPLWQQFDMVAGTSTGATMALAIALDIDIERVVDLYRHHAEQVFRPRLLCGLRKGPRYDQQILRRRLVDVFGNKQLRDARCYVIAPASCLDQFSHRVFCSFPSSAPADSNLTAVDVVLASAAAPTYFPPVKPSAQERSYLDGGLWANSPSLVAALWATCHLAIPSHSIRLLSIGTGDFPRGLLFDQFAQMRGYSLATVRALFELMFASQESAADYHTKEFLAEDNYLRVSTQLQDFIALDDAQTSIKKLPALAEMQEVNNVVEFLSREDPKGPPRTRSRSGKKQQDTLISEELIREAGLTAFYPSRRFYVYRKGASSIDTYVDTARKSVVMVSINLMTGLPFDGLCTVLQSKLENETDSFSATISLLNPFKADLIFAISPTLNRTKDQLFDSIKDTLEQLVRFRLSLSREAQKQMAIRVHNTIPFGSAILIDHRENDGRIQIETKPYKAVLNESFAFEVAPFGTSGLYRTLINGYESLFCSERDAQTNARG